MNADGLRLILQKTLKTTGIGAAKPVDGLIGIADDKYRSTFGAPGTDQLILQIVDILKFIDQQMMKHAQHVFVPFVRAGKSAERMAEQIVKIHQGKRCQLLLIQRCQRFGAADIFRQAAVFLAG